MYEQTRKDLIEMIALLKEDGAKHWVKFFQKALRAFDASDYMQCAHQIKSGRGGMGRLDDLILGQEKDENGKFSWKTEYKEMNQKYSELLERLYVFSEALTHYAPRPPTPE